MPNSLTYILQRGQRLFTSGTCCGFGYVGRSPRRALFHARLPWVFKGPPQQYSTPDPKSGRGLLPDHCWPARGPTSQLDAFPWSARAIKERRLRASWKLEVGDPQVRLLRVAAMGHPVAEVPPTNLGRSERPFRNVNRIPFPPLRASGPGPELPQATQAPPRALDQRPRAQGLGTTHPRSNAVGEEPFPSSALGGLTRVLATTTKICTSGCSRASHESPLPS